MIILQNYRVISCTDGFLRIQSKEHSSCSSCGGKLRVRDSRHRRVINAAGEVTFYRLRRFKCQSCARIHTELPDCIVPYKHYAADVIESELIH
ncbi:DUF6431 domain-containing protein [Scatolibacter rhodanostii]|uniref:DUF6431 domain-containing protein n=1 Tax=Scatolibacter rhodanostii TaxID=2014781 RepID=UPI00117EAFF8|nr:DUF6431 domain-containing protein [Scatolibacter rhodanostii]